MIEDGALIIVAVYIDDKMMLSKNKEKIKKLKKQLAREYQGDTKNNLIGYVDADWAADINNHWSITGHVFILAGAAISWSSKKQTSVALSSTEAEYMATAAVTKEAIWLHTLFNELNTLSSQLTTLLIDNQSAMALAKNAMFHDCTKHITIQHHFNREKLDLEEGAVEYVPTTEQVVDVLTKGLAQEKHVRVSENMDMVF